MSLQYDDGDDEYDDDTDEDEDEGEMEGEPQSRAAHRPQPMGGKRRLRTRPMTPSMMAKHPQVVSILLTRSNGQQLIFIRK